MIIEDLFIQLKQAIKKNIDKVISLYDEISNKINELDIPEEKRLEYKNQLKVIKEQVSYLQRKFSFRK